MAEGSAQKARIAILISGRGSNMVSLIEAAKAKDYPAEITLVVSNRPDAAGLELARKANVPTLVVDHRPHVHIVKSLRSEGKMFCRSSHEKHRLAKSWIGSQKMNAGLQVLRRRPWIDADVLRLPR